MVVVTDSDGVAEFEFNSEPPYGDASEYGELTLKVDRLEFILADESMQTFNSEFNKGVQPDYTYEGEGDTIPWWLYVVAVLVIAALEPS